MEIKFDLTEQEYQSAFRLCDTFGLKRSHEHLLWALKKIMFSQSFDIPMPLGTIIAWVDAPPPNLDVDAEIGIGFRTEEGDFVDLASAKYNGKTKKIETKVFSDICSEDSTSNFAFGEKDIKKAFSAE